MRRLLPCLVTVLVWPGSLHGQRPAPGSSAASLAAGMRQVDEGDLEAAVITLDAVVQRLKREKGPEKDLATAHLYLAMAHLGLNQGERARADMREAWRNNKDMRLDPKKYPPRVIQLYEQAKRETAPAAPAAASAQRGGGKTVPILIGVGVVAGAGVVLAASGGGSNTTPPPTAAPACSPGQITASNARFEPARYTCPPGDSPFTYTVLTDVSNASGAAVTVDSLEFGTLCVSACTNCFCNPLLLAPRPFSPAAIAAGARATLTTVVGGNVCTNGGGSGHVEIRGTVRINTSCGSLSLQTVNTHRSEWP